MGPDYIGLFVAVGVCNIPQVGPNKKLGPSGSLCLGTAGFLRLIEQSR